MNLFDIDTINNELNNLENEITHENFWNDSKNSKIVLQKIKNFKSKKIAYDKIINKFVALQELNQLLQIEYDSDLASNLLSDTNNLEKEIEKLEIKTFFAGKYDANNAIITIHPGARRN